MEPVLEAGTVDLLGEEIGRGNLDEDKKGGVRALADLGGEADVGDGLDEADEGGFSLGTFWAASSVKVCSLGEVGGRNCITIWRDLVVDNKVDATIGASS